MKKFFSLIIAFVLIVCVFPANANATEIDIANREQLLSLACQVFPEYATKIAADQPPSAEALQRSSAETDVVISETRKVNDNMYMTYTELSNGVVTLANFVTYPSLTYNYRHNNGDATNYTVTLTGTAPGSYQTFTATNVKFTIYSSDYDCITSVGAPKVTNPDGSTYTTDIKTSCSPNETSSNSAVAYYRFPVMFGSLNYSGVFTLSIKNNVSTVDYYAE